METKNELSEIIVLQLCFGRPRESKLRNRACFKIICT